MGRSSLAAGVFLLLFCSSPAWCQSPPSLTVPLPTESVGELSKLLKSLALQYLPPVLKHESTRNWGQQATVPTLQGLKVVRVSRNHGNWHRTRVVSDPLAKHLELRIHDLQTLDAERLKFKIFLALPVNVDYEQQTWQNGLRIFGGHVRARLRVKLDLGLETRIKLDTKGDFLPDVVIDFKVADAKVAYDNFVLEYVNGIGGDPARLMGEAVRGSIHRWLPRLERHALEKGKEAILKAGQSREVRVNLAKIMKLPTVKSK